MDDNDNWVAAPHLQHLARTAQANGLDVEQWLLRLGRKTPPIGAEAIVRRGMPTLVPSVDVATQLGEGGVLGDYVPEYLVLYELCTDTDAVGAGRAGDPMACLHRPEGWGTEQQAADALRTEAASWEARWPAGGDRPILLIH